MKQTSHQYYNIYTKHSKSKISNIITNTLV